MIRYQGSDGGRDKVYPNEKNDCTVRTIVHACQVPYKEAHQFMARYSGRQNRHSANLHTTVCRLESAVKVLLLGPALTNGQHCMDFSHPVGYQFHRRQHPTLNQFVKDHPQGRYIVTTHGHALAIIDGIVHDTFRPKIKAKVLTVWKIIKPGLDVVPEEDVCEDEEITLP